MGNYRIIARIRSSSETVGYVLIDSAGNTMNVKSEQVMAAASNGRIVNARYNKYTKSLEGINCDLRKIPSHTTEELNKIKSSTKSSESTSEQTDTTIRDRIDSLFVKYINIVSKSTIISLKNKTVNNNGITYRIDVPDYFDTPEITFAVEDDDVHLGYEIAEETGYMYELNRSHLANNVDDDIIKRLLASFVRDLYTATFGIETDLIVEEVLRTLRVGAAERYGKDNTSGFDKPVTWRHPKSKALICQYRPIAIIHLVEINKTPVKFLFTSTGESDVELLIQVKDHSLAARLPIYGKQDGLSVSEVEAIYNYIDKEANRPGDTSAIPNKVFNLDLNSQAEIDRIFEKYKALPKIYELRKLVKHYGIITDLDLELRNTMGRNEALRKDELQFNGIPTYELSWLLDGIHYYVSGSGYFDEHVLNEIYHLDNDLKDTILTFAIYVDIITNNGNNMIG